MNYGFSWWRRRVAGGLLAALAWVVSIPSSGAPVASVDWSALTADDAVPNQLLVRFNPVKAPRNALGVRTIQTHQALGATVRREFGRIPWQVVAVPPRVGLAAAAAAYAKDPAVVAVEPNYIVHADALPDDPGYDQLWGMERIGAPAVWDVSTGSSDVIVAILDTGIRHTHQDLADNLWVNPAPTFGDVHGARWTNGDGTITSGDPMDGHGHGTHVAGTIGAVGNNGIGVVGVNWSVKLMALKFLADSGSGSTADAIAAIEYAIAHGAHLSNNSWGGGPYSAALEAAIDAAGAANQLFVAAAGNSGSDNDLNPHYPSSYALENIIAVASITSSGALSSFSCYGAASVDLAAPGSDIYSCWSTSDAAYNTISGTSMATPHVSGAVAMLLALQPGAPFTAVRDVLYATARPNPALAGMMTTGAELDLALAAGYLASPEVTLDREGYRSDASAVVQVLWPLAPYTERETTVTLSITNAAGTVLGTTNVVCQWVGVYNSVLARFVSGPVALGPLGAEHGAMLGAVWSYPVDFTDYEDTAPIDDVAPVISNLRVTARDQSSLTIAWDTDELATGAGRAGLVLPPSAGWAETLQDTPATNHEVRIAGLAEFTPYYLSVWAEDAAGNRSYQPADPASTDANAYTNAFTIGFETVARHDWERSGEGWTATNINAATCWEYGQPTHYGPLDATRCWGTVLDGRYPDGANATLTSPAFKVRLAPVLRFRHWLDVQYSMDFDDVTPTPVPYGDYGQVEVLLDGVWQNVTPYADVSAGADSLHVGSDGWVDVRVDLPAEYAQKTLAVRFRFVSDDQRFLDGNPAGWYIDDVVVQDVPDTHLAIAACDVVDLGPGLSGDGDGFAEPGETVALRPWMFNFGDATVPNPTGSLVALVSGNPSAQAVLLDGSPAPVAYASIDPWSMVPESGSTRLQLSPNLPPGTVVSLLQTLTDGDGQTYQSRYDLVIDNRATILGTVVDAVTAAPVPSASVVALRGSERFEATTDGNGAFLFNGMASNGLYSVTASLDGTYAPSTVTALAPTNGLVVALGNTAGFVAPSNLVFTAVVGGMDVAPVTVSNAVDATVSLVVTPQAPAYSDSNVGWLSWPTTAFSLTAGQSHDLQVTASATNLPVGHYVATLRLDWNDPLRATVQIPVEFFVLQEPLLDFAGYQVQNDTDADGHLEAGETGDLYVSLLNTNSLSDVYGVHGLLTPLDPRVTLTGTGDLGWTYIAAGGSSLSDNGVGLSLDSGIADGEALPFQLEVWTDAGPTNTLTFTVLHGFFYTASGIVEQLATPANLPVYGAVVRATASDGTVLLSAPTLLDGLYSIPNVPSGNTWFQVIPPVASPLFVAPAGLNVDVNADPTTVDFVVWDYGTNSPHLAYYDVQVDDASNGDGDGAIDPGERLVVQVRVYNEGPNLAAGLSGVLATADMGVGVGPFMTVVSGAATAVPNAISPSNPAFNQYILATLTYVVDVDPAAQAGDMQRFTVDVSDANLPTARNWPFDFSLTVGPVYSIGGTVSFENPLDNTSANLAMTRVVATVDGTESTLALPPDGTYRFVGIPEGSQVSVRCRPPTGFVAAPVHVFDPLTDDQAGVDFLVSRSEFTVTPVRLDETVLEGQSATNTLTLANGSSDPLDVTLAVSYNRGPYDVVDPGDQFLQGLLEANPVGNLATADAADAEVSGELEIRFKDGTGWMERQAILERHGLRALFHFRMLPACVAVPVEAATSTAEVTALATALSSEDGVLYVQPSGIVAPNAIPNDALFGLQQNLQNTRQTDGTLGADVNVVPAWDVTTGSRDVIVAVCDTGVNWTHEDLAANIWTNPLDGSGDVNGDGYPGVLDADDDGDAESQLTHFNLAAGQWQGPETVDARFDPEMWRDDYTLMPVPGTPGAYFFKEGSNNLPDFFEPYLAAVNGFSMANLLADPRFVDSDGNDIPDLLEDLDGDGTPDLFADEDGDGIVNETGIDFRDEDVMTADYNGNGVPLIRQQFVMLPWLSGAYFRVLVEKWDIATDPDVFTVSGLDLARTDDDENGYADDVHGWNFYDWNSEVTDSDLETSHGTHVAGTLGAVGGNGSGIAGVSQQVSIMPLRLTGEVPRHQWLVTTTTARIAKAIEYALDQDVRVSNHSWSGSAASGLLYEVMKLAELHHNHLFVAAAGNYHRDLDAANDIDNTRIYPAYFSTVLKNVIAVTATDADDKLASFSAWGKDSVQIAAPGVDILSTVGGNAYARLSGTSMAAPHVAGAAALLWAEAPDASYESVKNAILVGSRPDPDLAGWVKTGAHLDIGRAFRSFGRDWLALSSYAETIAGGDSAQVQVVFNPDLNLPAGFFEAEITAESSIGTRVVPVTLSVSEQPVARVKSIRVVSDSDGDGFAEPGETVEFHVTLENVGSAVYLDLQGLLAPASLGASVLQASSTWDILYNGEMGESQTAFRVTLPGSSGLAEFALALTATGAAAQTVPILLGIESRYALSGRVVNLAGGGVSNATVECWGAAGGRAVTDADGYYAIHGLVDGGFKVRAIPPGHARTGLQFATVAGADAGVPDLVVASPVVTFSTNQFAVAVQQGYAGQWTIGVTNLTAEAYPFQTEVMPRRRIALFSDGDTLGPLAAPLRRMGFEVDAYTNNFDIVHVRDEATGLEHIVQQVQYTWDDGIVFQYDFIIADLTGAQGNGRVLNEWERSAFERYLQRGGKVLFTGANPLTTPDNEGLAALCGLGVDTRSPFATGEAVASADWTGLLASSWTPGSLALGDRLATTATDYDLAPSAGAEVLFTAFGANKLTRYVANAELGGTAYLWSGNAADSDWASEGLWQDVLRDLLRETFYQPAATQTRVPWLQVTPVFTNLFSAGMTVDLGVNQSRQLMPGSYGAVVLFTGPSVDEEITAIPFDLTVSPPTLRAYTSGQVTDWRGQPLAGDGGPTSTLFQVIYAGADGVANPPNTADGAPTGDDELLAAYPSGEAFGRFGVNVAANLGRFDQTFAYPFPIGTADATVFVRAWDAASFGQALVWGDSTVRHTATYLAGEARDFGSWSLTNIVDYLRDSNGDSIPDGWIIENRPDLDPRGESGALDSEYSYLGMQPVLKNLSNDASPRPYRVVVSKPSAKFVFALDNANNRIAIIQTNNPTAKVFFTPTGTNAFAYPEGMAADPRTGQYRLAVADTSNHRVELFTYDPVTGALTFERVFGTYGSGNGNLNRPAGVAFDNTGRLFVADKVNNRVAIFRVSDGAWLGSFAGTGSYVLSQPQGLCVDTDLDGGVWVCDSLNNRVTLYSASGVFKRSIGSIGSGNGQFQSPVDAKIWRSGSGKRLAVVDKSNNRIQLFTVDGEHLLNVGVGGQLAGQLSLPHGVFPMDNESVLCVADTQNGRVQWFGVTLDGDGDGMDDLWEDAHGLDSSDPSDADGDPDGDGVSNLGEFLIGTDPQDPNTDGDTDNSGDPLDDGWELANGTDPLDPADPAAPVNPPHVVSFTADPATINVGETTTVTVVYDQPVTNTASVVLELAGGVVATLPMTQDLNDPTTFTLAYTAQPTDNGVVTGLVSGARSEALPSYLQNPLAVSHPALFTVVGGVPGVITSITALPASAVAGDVVTVTVTFSDPVVDGTPKLALSGAATLAATAMTKVNATNYVYVYTVQGSDASGTVAAEVSDAQDQGTGLTVASDSNASAFTITFPAFAVTAISMSPPSISWEAVAGGSYNLETNASLTAPAWGVFTNVTAVNQPTETVLFDPPAYPMFFRIKRVNP